MKIPDGRHASSGAGSSRTSPAPASGWVRRAAGAGDHLRDAVPDVRRAALRVRRVRQRAAGDGGRRPRAQLRGLPFSIPAAVGFIARAGVAVLERRRHGQRGVAPAGVDAGERRQSVARARRRCCARCSTTAAVAAFGFMPMAIRRSAGAEVQRPLATVVIGGILSSTAAGAAGAAGDAAPAGRTAGSGREGLTRGSASVGLL